MELEMALWAVAEGHASPEDDALVEAEPAAARRVVRGLIADIERGLESARSLPDAERQLVVEDFEGELVALRSAFVDLIGEAPPVTADDRAGRNADDQTGGVAEPEGEVRLQASWVAGHVVVWAAGPGTAAEGNEELAARLEAIGGPALGWSLHPDVVLPAGRRAEALVIPVKESLGWLVAVAGGLGRDGVGASVAWLGHVAAMAVRLVARGAVAPTLRRVPGAQDQNEFAVRWNPALLTAGELDEVARAMPGPIVAIDPADGRSTTLAVLGAVVDAILTNAATRVELPAPPPSIGSAAGVAEAVATRLDGSRFRAPSAPANEVARRLDGWVRPVTRTGRPALVVQLQPPDASDAWFLEVLGPVPNGRLAAIETALRDGRDPKLLLDELARLERLVPALRRPGQLRRGQVVLSQAEAWELMTVTGGDLEAAGFTVRLPALSRRKPTPSLRLFAERSTDSVVGAHQLSDVRWSVLFDDVELTAAEIARLAGEARPLVRSRGRWVELDHVDLKEAAAALAERAGADRLTGAEILRYGIGVEGTSLAGGLTIDGNDWANELLQKARETSPELETHPEGFVGELRSYQAQALAWLDFLDDTGLGGCLALDMGLGKTPTVLAHLAGTTVDNGPALVIAPAAVVGNWAAEAARFTPGLRVVVHHGADRATAAEFAAEVADADIVITTYGTAVRDVEAIAGRAWGQVILDEAQAIKNSASDTAQQLRRIGARTRLALTGTPVENGLGDLWSILDYTNPGLVGPRPAFIAQMSGEGEAALRALNGILVFRRTKVEPDVAAELPDRIDELDHCTMTAEQIGLYQAILDQLVASPDAADDKPRQGAILAAITALKQVCNHPAAYEDDGRPLAARSGKLARLEEIIGSVFVAGEKILVFTHFAEWGRRLATHLTEVTGTPVACYDGSLTRIVRDRIVDDFQRREGPGVLVLSLKAGGTGLNLTAASHVVLYDRWWNPAVEDQARDRAWRIGQTRTVISHRLVCPGTIDERVEEVVAGKRHIADLVLPKSSSLADLGNDQLRLALGLRSDAVLTEQS